MLLCIRTLLNRFRRDRAGLALIEFVFFFPVAAILLWGGLELGRYVLITQKIEKSGYVLGDVVSQFDSTQLTTSAVNTILTQYGSILRPYGTPAKQMVVFSSVTKDPVDHLIKIRWQRVGGGTLHNSDTVSIVSNLRTDAITSTVNGTEAQFTGDVQDLLVDMLDGENMIVTEVYFVYEPIFADLLGLTTSVTTTNKQFALLSRTLVRRTYFHPRNGDLNNPPV